MAPAVTSVLELGAEARSVAEIEREIARRRRHAAGDGAEGSPARATALNVVVHATRRVHAERAARTIADLGTRHPSRAIVLLQGDGSNGDDVRLSAYERPNDSGQICYEQIVVRAGARASSHQLRSVVIPLLIADLPTFLWCTGTPPLGSLLFAHLTEIARRLVVDSADFGKPEETLPKLSALLGADDTTALTDLNWARLTPWRELVAQFFDVPEWRPFLRGISGVRIGFAVDMDGRDIHPSQALLAIGWLAARLGWRPDEHLAPSEAGGALFRMARADGGPVWIRLRPRFLRGVGEGNVTGIRVLAQADARRADFVVKRDEAGAPLADTAVTIDGRVVARRRVYLPMPGVGALLAEELSILRSDRVYEDALATLCALT